MKNRIRWRFVAAMAVVAMVVTLVSGGFGKVSIGILIMRMLSGGIIFAVLAVGLSFLFLRLYPEIFMPDAQDADEDYKMGSRVDIIAGDDIENELAGADVMREEDNQAFESNGTFDNDLDSSSVKLSDEKSSPSLRSTKDLLGSDHDPEEMAKAIHTVINRDKKG